MIFFGTKGVKSKIKSGNFECPQCATSKPYHHIKVTKYFTLYFIPIIPLNNLGEYVECSSCKGTFVPRILEYSPDARKNEFQATYEKAMRHSMILMMLADGVIDDVEKFMVLMIINKFGHNDMTMDELTVLVEEVQKIKEPVGTYLSKIAPELNEHGKETIIKCALVVAKADGNIDEREFAVIQEMGTAMEMSSSHLKGIIQDFVQENTTFSDN